MMAVEERLKEIGNDRFSLCLIPKLLSSKTENLVTNQLQLSVCLDHICISLRIGSTIRIGKVVLSVDLQHDSDSVG